LVSDQIKKQKSFFIFEMRFLLNTTKVDLCQAAFTLAKYGRENACDKDMLLGYLGVATISSMDKL
jgi:hypothetical protein